MSDQPPRPSNAGDPESREIQQAAIADLAAEPQTEEEKKAAHQKTVEFLREMGLTVGTIIAILLAFVICGAVSIQNGSVRLIVFANHNLTFIFRCSVSTYIGVKNPIGAVEVGSRLMLAFGVLFKEQCRLVHFHWQFWLCLLQHYAT
jgi:hypothetical protein